MDIVIRFTSVKRLARRNILKGPITEKREEDSPTISLYPSLRPTFKYLFITSLVAADLCSVVVVVVIVFIARY